MRLEHGDPAAFLFAELNELLSGDLGNIVELKSVSDPTRHAIRQISHHALHAYRRQAKLRVADVFGILSGQ